MEWIIGSLIVWNIILTSAVSSTERRFRALLVRIYQIGKGEITLENFALELQESKNFEKVLREFKERET